MELTCQPCVTSTAVSFRPALARPSQRRRGIAPRQRLDQRLQRGVHAGLRLFDPWASRADATNARRGVHALGQFAACVANRFARQPCGGETSASPPYPIATDSVAAQRRRARSSSTGAMTTNFATIVAATSVLRFTYWLDHSHGIWQVNYGQSS